MQVSNSLCCILVILSFDFCLFKQNLLIARDNAMALRYELFQWELSNFISAEQMSGDLDPEEQTPGLLLRNLLLSLLVGC